MQLKQCILKKMKPIIITTLRLMKSVNRLPLQLGLLLIPLVFVCIGLLPKAEAVVPPPDGGYPNFTTAEGTKALQSLTTGSANTAVGWFSLGSVTTDSFNTAFGAGTLALNTGDNNTATGAAALLVNTTGSNNTATGLQALFNNTSGSNNTATGLQALFDNTTGSANTANGASALASNTAGNFNTATGASALFQNAGGSFNTAIGLQALSNSQTGNNNTVVGAQAGGGIVTASNVICIGDGVTGADVGNTCFIGNIRGTTTQNANAIPVLIDSVGQLGTLSSSRRYKTDIKPMDKASEAILALKPVSFRYKVHKDTTPQFGLIAEEVAEVNPDLVVRDEKGDIYTVRYDAVNAMLLNEFLKEHNKVEEQQATITQLKKDFGTTIVQLTARLDEEAAKIQKVSAQLEASKAAPQVVNNP
jgi:hypothetical protein